MRDARAADWLRRLRTRQHDWQTRLDRFAVKAVPSIGTIEMPFQSPLTVFSGPNGVGKTTLLRAMWAALDPESAAATISVNGKLSAGSALVELTSDSEAQTGEVQFSAEAPIVIASQSVTVHHIDSAALTPLHQKTFCEFESVEEIVNGAGPRELDDQMLAEVSYIVHRQYRTVTMYEVELGSTVPFFEVSYGNDRYDSRTMGAGELSCLYIWWAVRRAEPNSILLIEEPEAFLSHGSQKSLSNFILESIVANRLVGVLSSHSAAFISALPKECLIFFARTQSGVSAITDRPPPVLLKEMGIEPAIRILVFVEDFLAMLLCRAILEKYDPLLSRQVHIDQRNGDGQVISALKPMIGVNAPIKFIALFDGDMRGKVPDQVAPISAFLPGEEPIEVLFRNLIERDPGALESATGNQNCGAIVGALEGKDHHDWYEELARELGLSRDQLFSQLFYIWMQPPENAEAAAATHEAIVALVG